MMSPYNSLFHSLYFHLFLFSLGRSLLVLLIFFKEPTWLCSNPLKCLFSISLISISTYFIISSSLPNVLSWKLWVLIFSFSIKLYVVLANIQVVIQLRIFPNLHYVWPKGLFESVVLHTLNVSLKSLEIVLFFCYWVSHEVTVVRVDTLNFFIPCKFVEIYFMAQNVVYAGEWAMYIWKGYVFCICQL